MPNSGAVSSKKRQQNGPEEKYILGADDPCGVDLAIPLTKTIQERMVCFIRGEKNVNELKLLSSSLAGMLLLPTRTSYNDGRRRVF